MPISKIRAYGLLFLHFLINRYFYAINKNKKNDHYVII